MLARSAWDYLISWKKRTHHPLVISGLRQTGKTFIVRAFGEVYYQYVVYLDLRANKTIRSAFEGDFDVDKMVLAISANLPSAQFVPQKTLLILDEVQDCPHARSSLKYWDLDGRFDVITTGSFLGVKGFREPYVRGVPVGYEEHYTMYPLTFQEFILNQGISADVVSHVQESLDAAQPVMAGVHESMRNYYYQYIVAGGMPEAVNTLLETHNVNDVQNVQRQILASIKDDFGRYKGKGGEDKINEVLKLRAEACLDSLPSQLAKDYKKFQYSLVNVAGHSTEKAEGLQYLVDVGLAIRVCNLREIAAPLEGAKIPNEFKVYYIDSGLLVSQLEQGSAAAVLAGNLGAYKGAIAENVVATSFAMAGIQPYYYHAKSGSPEIDFVFSNEGVPTLVECKATNKRMTSMRYVLEHPKKYGAHPAIKYADTNVGKGNGFLTFPHYALGFLSGLPKSI